MGRLVLRSGVGVGVGVWRVVDCVEIDIDAGPFIMRCLTAIVMGLFHVQRNTMGYKGEVKALDG